jgi:ribonuclease T1
MRRHLRKPWIWIAALLVLAVWLLWPRPVASPGPDEPAAAPVPATMGTASSAALPGFLPAEATATVERILRGGPHPHAQDGGVFGNRENLLPQRPRGHYREYTVATPGLGHRGARRIVTGGDPPREWYYTDDHYDSFRRFEVAP